MDMTAHDSTRRTFLKAAGAAGAVTAVAGCLSSDEGNEDENENDTDDGNESGDGVSVNPGTQIMLSGQTSGWEGLEPSKIEGEQNPTLVLQAGEEYELGWSEGDGLTHNIEIRTEDGEVVDDLSTEETSDPGEDQILSFEASEEMAYYVCNPHESAMRSEIQVQ